MEHLPSPSSLPQEQADDAAAAAAQFWPEFGRRWRWTRQQSLAPVYTLIGQMTVALLRSYPAIQHSNQARWYQRSVRDTPAIYALFPEEFIQQAKAFIAGGDAREIEGKQVVSFLYLAPGAGGATEVVKTLLASTATEAPYYRVQLAHELLNCFCATSWDGRVLRSGLRRATWGTGTLLQRGGALNDLLIDTQLLDFLPQATDTTRASLMEGMLGPYWQIIERFAQRLEQVPTLDVLFGRDESLLTTFEHELESLLNLRNAVAELERLLVRHDWQGLQTLVKD
jgi:hypothetical protein